MSTITNIEQKYFEDLLGMASGYVLDFSNNSFSAFFRKNVNIDIYLPKYSTNGESKANRLRSFCEIESDEIVGKVLEGLLEIWKYNSSKNGNFKNDSQFLECKKITCRLLGKKYEIEDNENHFLNIDFGNISIEKLNIDTTLMPIIKSRIKEADTCLKCGCSLAAIFLCGSLLEGILLGYACQNSKSFNQAQSSPKDKDGKVKRLPEWSLANFIDVSCELGLLTIDIKKFGHALRDFRNYIHPYEQMASKFNPDLHTAKICFQVFKAAVACLTGTRNI